MLALEMAANRKSIKYLKSPIKTIAGIALATGILATVQPAQAAKTASQDIKSTQASCPALPEVAWWKTTHAKIVRYVDKKFQGNWDPYITKWINYRTKMQKIYDRDGSATVKSRDLRLSGDNLARHIKQIDQRIDVTRCLKRFHAGRLARITPQGAPVNGGTGNDTIVKARQASKVAEVTGNRLDLEINATCDGPTPVFQVTNLGDKWPRLAAISIYRTSGKAMVSKRRMKLANSQQATFKIRKRGKALKGEIGLFVQPSWSKRGFKYDSRIRCS